MYIEINLFFKVLWHTGLTTWVRDEKLPKHFHETENTVVFQEKVSFGQTRKITHIEGKGKNIPDSSLR